MSYFVVVDFRGGLDTRRIPPTAQPGTLRSLRNAAVNRGGEIEKRKAFSVHATLPAGTHGLGSRVGKLFVFGFGPDPGVPLPVLYREYTPPGGEVISRILQTGLFGGAFHNIIEYTDGEVDQYWNGSRVTNLSIGGDIGDARVALPYGAKMYAAAGSVLFSSKVEVVNFDSGETGVGFNDMSTSVGGAETVTGLAEYNNLMAVFTRRTIQTWSFAADPAAAARVQTVNRIGTTSPRSVLSFAGNDVLFLSDYGVRSLRARTGTDTAAVSDIGSPIDELVIETLRGMTATELENAFAEIEPTTGRYWLTMGGQTYVFSYFPGSKVSAWSTYDMPAGASAAVAVDNKLYIRAGNVIYAYGGADGITYDAAEAEVELPFLDGRQIATWKAWRGLDIAAEGTWKVYAAFDPAQPDAEDEIATLSGSTMYQLDVPMLGHGPLVKLRFVSQGSGAAKLSSVIVHYHTTK